MDEARNKWVKVLRQRMLAVVRQFFGGGSQGWITEELLFDILAGHVTGLTGRDVHEAAVYCASQGYMETVEKPHDKRVPAEPHQITWRITAKGVNLVDGNIDKDPGIEDNRA